MAEIYMPRHNWARLLNELWLRSEGFHESGAFLLGIRDHARRCVGEWILYDDYDPASLASGIVTLDGTNLGRLWAHCQKHRLEIVADIHTHPFGARQSPSDRDNPIVAIPGHIALIVPRFARPPVQLVDIKAYEYLGGKKWRNCPPRTLVSDER